MRKRGLSRNYFVWPSEFDALLHQTGTPTRAAARILGRTVRTVSDWRMGNRPVPRWAFLLLQFIVWDRRDQWEPQTPFDAHRFGTDWRHRFVPKPINEPEFGPWTRAAQGLVSLETKQTFETSDFVAQPTEEKTSARSEPSSFTQARPPPPQTTGIRCSSATNWAGVWGRPSAPMQALQGCGKRDQRWVEMTRLRTRLGVLKSAQPRAQSPALACPRSRPASVIYRPDGVTARLDVRSTARLGVFREVSSCPC